MLIVTANRKKLSSVGAKCCGSNSEHSAPVEPGTQPGLLTTNISSLWDSPPSKSFARKQKVSGLFAELAQHREFCFTPRLVAYAVKILNRDEKPERKDKIMKKLLGASLAILFLLLGNAKPQTLSQADLDRALKYLESTKDNLVASTRGLSDAQWNFKQSLFRWSAAQVLEHIAASEDFLRGIVENQVLKAPAPPERDIRQLDEKVLSTIPDRAIKATAPAPLRPTNRFGSPEAALKHFLESRAKTLELLKTRNDLRAHAVDTALGGKLDAYEWILVIAAHSERHTKQLNEVKADPKFPKQ